MSILKAQAAEVLELLARGYYLAGQQTVHIAHLQQAAQSGTKLYTPEVIEGLRSQSQTSSATGQPIVDVRDGTTQQVAQQLIDRGKLGMLNFASARNPGGGFLRGAKAQEEDLCRCSGLYNCIVARREYYDANRQTDSKLYTDYAIYSPNVPFFKTRSTGEYLTGPFVVSVITAPAPNSGPYLRNRSNRVKELEETFERRWENVLCIAKQEGITVLILGAWGCGAFGGDPEMAARTAQNAIQRFGGGIDHICFAIPDSGNRSAANFKAFSSLFPVTTSLRRQVNRNVDVQFERKSDRGESHRIVNLSKFLSLVLRHQPEVIGATLDSEGWLEINQLIVNAQAHGHRFTLDDVHEVVVKNDKQRFAISDDGLRIRANQGHSISKVDLQLEPRTPPAELYHGTVAKFLDNIREKGLQKQSRNHVHLSVDVPTASKVASRRGKPIILHIDSQQMHADGFSFYLSANNVWLANAVPAKYIRFPEAD